ncbi:MAG: isocitrate/isopropylmalate family dehydrogenase, partial [ANME-2 cluster archaeon]|nr:isocitrate/isopropylmalate family dehydrogenase [ANME-2 cluster archaeon]
GMNRANPIATIWAGAMMVEQMGEAQAADAIVAAIGRDIKEAKVLTKDMSGNSSTSDVGDEIVRLIKDMA